MYSARTFEEVLTKAMKKSLVNLQYMQKRSP